MKGDARKAGRLAWRVALLALVACASSSVGCRAKGKGEGASESAGPVAPPANLLAEGVIATPDATWQRIQRGAGGGAGLLPTTLGGLLSGVAGLDAKLGPEINGASPAYVVVAGEGPSPSWALAARLLEERRARPLFEGEGAVFDARDAGGGVEILSPRGKPSRSTEVVAVVPGGWLVVANDAAALVELTPYATRALPAKLASTKEAVAIDVLQSALAGAIAGMAADEWGATQRAMLENDRALREAHGGRAPDYGDPRAIISSLDGWVQKRISALRDLRGAHLGIDVGDGDVHATLTASPASAGGAASLLASALRTGDVAPLQAVPRETVLALLARDDARSRAADATDFETALATTLGPRLTSDDAKRVHAAIGDWSEARGDWATLAFTLTPADRGVVADIAASDPGRLARSVREALELYAHVPAIHDPVGGWLHAHSVSFGAGSVPGGGHAAVATFKTDDPSPLLLAWTPSPADSPATSKPGDVKLALGVTPLPLLAPSLPGATLGDDPELRAAIASVGSVAGAVLVQPSRIPGCSATGGILLAWGTRPAAASVPAQASAHGGPDGQDALWATLVASDSSLRCAVKSLF